MWAEGSITFPAKMLDNSTCILTLPEAKERSDFTFGNDNRNNRKVWDKTLP